LRLVGEVAASKKKSEQPQKTKNVGEKEFVKIYFFLRSKKSSFWGRDKSRHVPTDMPTPVLVKSQTPGSISPTFYEQLFHQILFAKKLQTQIVST
jgi:hypothetical protein